MFKKTPKLAGSKQYTIGRKGFAKISAIEGIRLTSEMKADFRSFDEKKLSPAQRREILSKKYA